MTDKDSPDSVEDIDVQEVVREREINKVKRSKIVTPRPIKNPVAKFFVLGSATGLGLGFLPFMPGTYGSLLGIPFGLWLLQFDMIWALAICAVFMIPAVWVSDRAGWHFGHRDSGKIVIDEVLGQGITLLGCSALLHRNHATIWELPWELVVLSFGLFRLLDIVKPFPARTLDRQANGLGVMTDDVVAGLYGAILMRFIIHMWYLSRGI